MKTISLEKYLYFSVMVHGFWKIRGWKCNLIVCFHKQVLFSTTEHLCVKNPPTFPNKLCKAHKHVVSPLSVSRFWPNSTCQLTLKCHNHWDVFLRLRCPGSKEERGTMAMSSWACHRVRLDWHMLGQITGVGDDGGLPCDSQPPAIRNPWKLGQTWAWLCPEPLWPSVGPSANATGRGGSSLGATDEGQSQSVSLPSHKTLFQNQNYIYSVYNHTEIQYLQI